MFILLLKKLQNSKLEILFKLQKSSKTLFLLSKSLLSPQRLRPNGLLQKKSRLKILYKNNFFCNQNYVHQIQIEFHHNTTTRASKFSSQHITILVTWPTKTNRPQCIHAREVIQKPSRHYLLKIPYTSVGETSAKTKAYQGRHEAWSPCKVFFGGFQHIISNSKTYTNENIEC